MNNGVMLVIVVEDSQFFADLTVRILKRSGLNVKANVVSSESALQEALNKGCCDIILSDNIMPGFSALAALKVRNELCAQTPFMIVSEDISPRELKEAFNMGCDSFLPKEKIADLPKLIEQLVKSKESIHEFQ